MSVTLQIELNGGAPQVGGVTGAIGDVVQLTAANKSTWGGAARWEIYDYPPSFTVPSGWTADGDGVFFVLGNADPPAFTISDPDDWGKYGFRVTVLDGAVLTTDDATALSIPSTGGIKSIMAGEGAQFGGTRERWVKDLKNDLRALAAGSGGGSGTVLPTADELVLRDGTGQAFATAFVGPAAAAATLLAQGSASVNVVSPGRDISLDAGRDVIIDVGSTSDEITIKAGGVTKATITPGASTVTVATSTGVALTASADGGAAQASIVGNPARIIGGDGEEVRVSVNGVAATIGDSSQPDALTITPNGSGGTTTIAAFQPMSINAAGAMTVQPAQATSGAGRRNTFASGDGQTPGTHLAGGIVQQLGAPVAGVTDEFEIQRRDGTKLLGVKQFASGFVWLDGGANAIDVRANASVLVRGPASVQNISPLVQRVDTASALQVQDVRTHVPLTTINTATTTNIGSGIPISPPGDGIDLVEAEIAWWNKTNTRGGARIIRRSFKRVGGTVTALGSLVEDDASSYIETGETGVTCDFTISGTAVIPRITTPDTDERRVACVSTQTRRPTWS